jgi:hypothetical protein
MQRGHGSHSGPGEGLECLAVLSKTLWSFSGFNYNFDTLSCRIPARDCARLLLFSPVGLDTLLRPPGPVSGCPEHLPELGLLRRLIGTAELVPEGEVLPKVVAEVQMVGRVVCGTVKDVAEDKELVVVDKHGPEVHKGEERKVDILVQGHNEQDDLVRERLDVSVHEMEGVRCERSGDDPLVVGLNDQSRVVEFKRVH